VTHYQLLGVLPTASLPEIRAAYVALARRHHPDRGGSADRMKEINDAWTVLSDTRRRRAYDLQLGVVKIGEDVPVPAAGDDAGADPADWDDTPLHDVRPLSVYVTVLPVVLFGASVLAGIAGMMLTSGGLLGLAIALFAASAALMILVPLMQMTRGRHRQ